MFLSVINNIGGQWRLWESIEKEHQWYSMDRIKCCLFSNMKQICCVL